MKKIALVIMFTSLEGEKGGTRFRYLANLLAEKGFEVDLITSTFQHWDKKQRDLSNQKNLAYKVVGIEEPGYKKNICLDRIKSHNILANNLKEYLEKKADYDLIYVSIPPNRTAAIVAEVASKKKIPFIVDVEDLWPEAMKMIVNIPVVTDIIYHSFKKDARKVYQLCDGIIGTSDCYRDIIDLYVKRELPRATVYVGNELELFEQGVEKFASSIDKPENEFWVMYTGMIGASYDIKTLIEAVAELEKKGNPNIKLKILGLGPEKEKLESYANRITKNVEFLGYVQFEKMAAYLSKTDITINSLKRKAPQSIVSKIADYLAAGKAMINTGSDEEFRNKVINDGFGINVEAENIGKLVEAILKLYKDETLRIEMGKTARKIAEEQFDRPQAYLKIVDMVNELL